MSGEDELEMVTEQQDDLFADMPRVQACVLELMELQLTEAAEWLSELSKRLIAFSNLGPDQADIHTPSHNLIYLQAHCKFQMRKYKEVTELLKDARDIKGEFLRLWALYVDGEIAKERHRAVNGLLCSKLTCNPNLQQVKQGLESALTRHHNNHHLNFLKAQVLLDLGMKEQARDVAVASVLSWPYNWCCWKILIKAIKSSEELNSLTLPHHWIAHAFFVSIDNKLHRHEHVQQRIVEMCEWFSPMPRQLLLGTALNHVHNQNSCEAVQVFALLQEACKYNMEGIHEYSNALYVQDDLQGLKALMIYAIDTHPQCPETEVVCGNYKSLKMLHQEAIEHYTLAVSMSSDFAWVWVLLGHEYVQLREKKKAVAAYRRAAELCPDDYRVYVGLGLCYENINAWQLALSAYQVALEVNPRAVHVYNGMADIYQQKGKTDKMLQCLHVACKIGDPDCLALIRLAQHYQAVGCADKAVYYWQQVVIQRSEEFNQDCENDDTVGPIKEGIRYMAEQFLVSGHLNDAQHYADLLINYGQQYEQEGLHFKQRIAKARDRLQCDDVIPQQLTWQTREQEEAGYGGQQH